MDDLTALLLHELFIQPWEVTKMKSVGEKKDFFHPFPTTVCLKGFQGFSSEKAYIPNNHLVINVNM